MSETQGNHSWSLRQWAPSQWLGAVLVVLTALTASVSGLNNEFVQDDLAIIRDNPAAHDPANYRAMFAEPYWPEGFQRDLYRPLATWSFALQWVLGDGQPRIYRLASYGLYAVVSGLLYLLLGRLFGAGIALAVGLLFAAHPVHVEAVAVAVNQGELWVALFTVLLTVWYLTIRRRGYPSIADWTALTGFYVIACLFKEHAVILPGFLLALELTILQRGALADRLRRLWTGYAVMALAGTGFLLVRARVIGDIVGSFTAEALVGQGVWGRTLTMLQIVPEWLRLLVWPARLQPDYSPSVISIAHGWGAPQTTATAIILSVCVLAYCLRRRAPTVLLGVIWFTAAILPVTNILVPTGIVLAERTLFLPSVGALVTFGGLASVFLHPSVGRQQIRRSLFVALVCTAVFLGIWRSASRHTEWRSQVMLWEAALRDAPMSYRVHHAYGELQWALGDKRGAVRSYHTAMALYPPAWWIRNGLALRFRLEGECHPALDLYAESLELNADQPLIRAARIACFLALAHYEDAVLEADIALALNDQEGFDDFHERFVSYRNTADSAARVGAPPGSVSITASAPPIRQ